jgi:V/A-type H+/Na+-transporting ATPase subunit D
MSTVKHTKTELKAQRDALRRFERFLPMLQLKKQQLLAELQLVDAKLQAKQTEKDAALAELNAWVGLFSESVDLTNIVSVEAVIIEEGNIAGVRIPVLQDVRLRGESYDLYETPPWVDDAAESVGTLARLWAECRVLCEQSRLLTDELRSTNQRVNLFEKVKIPECRDNIRVIKIFLGDEQTAAVARGKLAKIRASG